MLALYWLNTENFNYSSEQMKQMKENDDYE